MANIVLLKVKRKKSRQGMKELLGTDGNHIPESRNIEEIADVEG